MDKRGCAMAAILDMLVLYGGRTCSLGDIQLGSRCDQTGDDYFTNELHIYSMKTSEYISYECMVGVDLGLGWESCESPLTSKVMEKFTYFSCRAVSQFLCLIHNLP